MMLHKIILGVILGFIISSSPIFCQVEILKNQNDSGTKVYIARDKVILNPGYTYEPTNGSSMKAYTDYNLISDINYSELYNENSFKTKGIDQSLQVGVTLGIEGVSQSGGANYSIPISIPTGTNGMQPNITLSYNSQGGSGIAGYGWDLSGLSVITRLPKTIYHDGKVEGVKINNNDVYAIDGNRLFAVSGTYSGNNTKYRTENETFNQITSYTNGSNVTRFKVETKDGNVIEYGNGNDATINSEGSNIPIAWKISKVTDNFGNYMIFKYRNIDRENVLDEILYTGNTGKSLQPYSKIKFVYGSRTDKNDIYISGSKISSNVLLTKVVVTFEEYKLYRKYELKYGFDGYSLLKEIQEFDASNDPINSSIFKYDNKGPAFERTLESILRGDSSDIIPGDYNGDGLSDFLSADYVYDEGSKFHTGYRLYLNNNGVFTLTGSPYIFPDRYEIDESKKKVSISNNYSLLNMDFNGDGRDDFAVIDKEYVDEYHKLDKVKIFLSTGTGFTESNIPAPSNKIIHPSYKSYFLPGDYDGNGTADYITCLSNGNSYSAYVVFPNFGIINYQITGIPNFGSILATSNDIQVIDFNGDGKNDLMQIKEGNCTIYTFNKIENNVTVEVLYNSGFPTKWHKLFAGDFNGDGKTDFLNSGNNYNWDIALSTGSANGFVFESFNPNLNVNYYRIKTGDYNGDGKSDILVANSINTSSSSNNISTSSSYNISIYYRQGNGFTKVSESFTGILASYAPNADYTNTGFISVDINGDGKTDEIMKTHYQSPLDVFKFNVNSKNLLLAKIKNGHGKVTEFNYSPLTQGNHYTKGTGTVFPVIDIKQPLNVVTIFKMANGIGGYLEQRYQYGGALVHRQGKGFLGFRTVSTIDINLNKKSISEFAFNSVYNTLWLNKQLVYKNNDNSLISETTFANNFVNMGGKRYFQNVSQIVINMSMQGFTNTKTFYYDASGNLTKTVSTIPGVENSEINNQYITAGSWLPSKLSLTTIKKTRIGQALYEFTNKYEYGIKGEVLREKQFFGLPNIVTKYYLYNDFGNLTNTTIGAAGMTSIHRSATYDIKGRYPISNINELGQISETTYNILFNVPETQKGIDGLITKYEYDGFGRLIKSIDPLGVVSTQKTGWVTLPNNQLPLNNAIYYVKSEKDGSPYSIVNHDVLDRQVLIENQTEHFERSAFQITTYDNKGNILKVTSPFRDGDTPVETTNYYDDLNRITKTVTENIETKYNYHYSNGNSTVTTINPANQASSNTIDPTGKIINATDNGGILGYEYNSMDKQTKITLNGLEMATMAYNQYGNQTKLVDKNAGTIQYFYDPFNRLIKQIDANGNQQQFIYDISSRLTNKSGPDGNTQYQFINSGNGINQIKKIESSNNTKHEFQYDLYGRLVKEKETIGLDSFINIYEYDIYGNVLSFKYPSGFQIYNKYNIRGYLIGVGTTPDDMNIMKDPIYNANGQLLRLEKGNLNIKNTYTNIGLPYTSLVSRDDVILENKYYYYNSLNGNLNGIEDYVKNKRESFQYDNLNRLTQTRVDNNTPINISYAQNGNILNKSDIGSYNYHPDKINAVSSITPIASNSPSNSSQNIIYNSTNKVLNITQGTKDLQFTYGHDDQRRKSIQSENNQSTLTKYYIGNYEKITIGNNIYEIHYVSGADGLSAMYVVENDEGNIYYVIKDHLGSITKLVNESGDIIAEQNFDAWGKKRNPNTWSYANIPSDPNWLHRGYTGHEHNNDFGLINMNGRMYDYAAARMLSPDNFVQEPNNTQNYNRYSYVVNNPNLFIDPDGNWAIIDDLIAAGIGGVINWATNGFQFNAKGLGYFGAGAAAGALALYGPAGWAAGGAIVGSSNAALSGARGMDIVKGGAIGAVSSIAGGYTGKWAAQGLGSLIINGLNVSSPVIKGVIGGAIGGGAGGYVGGFTGGFLMTGDLMASNRAGLQGAKMGFGIGSITGAGSAYASSKKSGINPWTGKPKNSITIGEGMSGNKNKNQLGVKDIAKDLGSDVIPEMPNAYVGKEVNQRYSTSDFMDYNSQWIEMKISSNAYIFDRGPIGNSSPYYNMEVGRTMVYPNVYNVYHIQQIQTIRILIIYR